MRVLLISIFLFFSYYSQSQTPLKGVAIDTRNNPVFAANVYLKSNPQKGVTTDFDGKFTISIKSLKDTLIVSFVGFKTKMVPVATIDFGKPFIVTMEENTQSLKEVIVFAQDPISEKFSVVKMNKLDIYLNPVSQGDPLKSITTLPASTTTDETANPSLRGSSADRSRVVFNDVPIYNPVRATQLTNQGFFSLFNPEIIASQYVYASNPPLTFGNTSAGLVDIQTNKKIENNNLQLSMSLASAGFLLSQKIKKDVSFFQVYGNYQFSNAFVGIQSNSLPNIKSFETKDLGLNFYQKINKKTEFNSFSYLLNEGFNGIAEEFTYKGDVKTRSNRFFTVNNLKFYSTKGVFSINSGINSTESKYYFGNIDSENTIDQVYTSVNYKWFVLSNTNIQFGVSQDYQKCKFKGDSPVYFYALSASSPSFKYDTTNSNNILEAYLYTNWDINDRWIFSSGMRSNIPTDNQDYYFSSQLGLKYKINSSNSLLLSGGEYHSYTIPSYYYKGFNLLSSDQIALDYSFEHGNTIVKAAVYTKVETGKQTTSSTFALDKVNTFGAEFFLEQDFYKYFRASFSYAYIDQDIRIDKKYYKGEKDFSYLVKIALQYNNPKLFSLAIIYSGRPGENFNSIVSSTFDTNTGFYEPQYSNSFFDQQYGNYNRIDVSLNRYFKFKSYALITYISINNALNTKNESVIQYNSNYSTPHFDYYQYRTIYFGLVWQLNY